MLLSLSVVRKINMHLLDDVHLIESSMLTARIIECSITTLANYKLSNSCKRSVIEV